MLFDQPLAFSEALKKLRAAGKLPTDLTASQARAIESSIRKYSGQIGERIVADTVDEYQKMILEITNPQQVVRGPPEGGTPNSVTEGMNPAQAASRLRGFLAGQAGMEGFTPRVDFALNVGQKVADGAGRMVQQNLNEEVVDEYPALELRRLHEREVPRGFRRGAGGELVPVPDDDWESRWTAAAAECGDTDAARVLEETGRMVALKASGIWQALGDGAGGYEDTLGNAYDPLAFNTGYRQVEVDRSEAEGLGLIGEGERAEAAKIDFGNLFKWGD